MTARSVPSSLAPIIEELELRQPKLVTKAYLVDIIEDRGLNLNPDDVSHRLQQQGWLLSLKTKDAWEFAPASRAGKIGSGDPFMELRATLYHRKELQVAVAYESAAWLHGFSRHPPEKDVISLPSEIDPPPALKGFRITHIQGQSDPVQIDQLPIWSVETLIVLMGDRPMSYRAWPTVMEWLGEATSRADYGLILKELSGRGTATWARTGYILEAGGRDDFGEKIRQQLDPSRKGPFYLGPRNSPGKVDKRWDVRDSILLYRSIPKSNRNWHE
ncbi:MAG: type IV toxin-antitoxin system AbiEi family antitoxin [Chloroflexota bacterium]|nr:type IV toxin-antitoxin system AbiEi family antitoxin [Chloroflexota bacterium]